jgi:hypothetical protein
MLYYGHLLEPTLSKIWRFQILFFFPSILFTKILCMSRQVMENMPKTNCWCGWRVLYPQSNCFLERGWHLVTQFRCQIPPME